MEYAYVGVAVSGVSISVARAGVICAPELVLR